MVDEAFKQTLDQPPEDWQFRVREGAARRIEGGLCNTLLQILHPAGDVALRINHPAPETLGIDPRREQAVLDMIGDAPWAPRCRYISDTLMVTDWVTGDPPIGGELTRLRWLAHALTSVHAFQEEAPDTALRIDIPALIRTFALRCPQPRETTAAVENLLERYEPAGQQVLCHHDWHPGNLIISSSGWTLLDWEFAGFGDPCLDVGSAINGFALNTRQTEVLARLTGFSVDTLITAASIMQALEIVWFAANPALTKNSAERLDNWLKACDR